MPTKDSTPDLTTRPDDRKVTSIQAQRLAALSGVDAAQLKGTISQLSDKLKWKIDPSLFLFQKVCGKVVKKDPVTGVERPVPFATVYVEDTDCSLISYFPKGWPWGWHFPFNCHREIIATTKTDKCGNFCVWVPRFDIDWVLRWRKERICFPIIFNRPSIGDLIPKLPGQVVGPWPPIPQPDPGPLRTLATLQPSVIHAIAGQAAGKLADRVSKLQTVKTLGTSGIEDRNLHVRAFEGELPPPLPPEFGDALTGQNVVAQKGASPLDGVRTAIALKLGVNAKDIADFDPSRFVGPFFRCYDILLPEWQRILDVPDITFRVTQDVNGDGVEENIYSESYFDVRWDATNIPDVTLVANSIAKESTLCDAPVVPCGNVPALLFAGFMPLDLPAYYDATAGYTVRPNRPKNGVVRPAAQTPFCGNVQFYGCVDVKQAKFYRVLQSVDGGTTFSAITGVAWNNYRNTGGAPIVIHADASGWYPVNPVDGMGNTVNRTDLEFPNLLLDWPTPGLGKSILKLEIGNASKANIAYSNPVAVQTDNTAPAVIFTQLAWKFVGEPDSALRNLLGIPCPTIHRGATPKAIELVFEVSVTAHHLRDASIGTSGCGGGVFAPVADPLNNPSHWHTSVLDNSTLLHQRYQLDASALEGAYSFGCTANSRAMNPSGADGGNNVPPDWFYDPVYIHVDPSIGVAVVDVN
ncbi:MAG TPA: hypothetical protein VFT64_11300 [Rickettsiales bacterium]|nr:hypothetical protein [Rickettsiales bacterium]